MPGTFVGNNALDLIVLADLIAVGGAFNGAKVGLSSAIIEPTRTNVIGDFPPPTFDGYAQKTITWLGVSVGDDGVPEVVGTTTEFRPTGSATGGSVGTVIIVNGAGDLLLAAKLPTVLPFATPLDQTIVTVRLRNTSGGLVASVG